MVFDRTGAWRRLYSASPWSNLTGAPICALEHLCVLRPFFDEVCLVLNQPGELEDRARSEGIPVWKSDLLFRGLRQGGIGRFVSGIGAVARSRLSYVSGLTRQLRRAPGILHVHALAPHLPYALLAGRLAGVPRVVTIHEPIGNTRETRMDLRVVQCLAALVVFLSEHMAQSSPAFLQHKGVVIPNHAELLEVQTKTPARRPCFVMAARMGRRKGVDLFLDICRRLKESGLDFEACLVGEWATEEIRQQSMAFLAANELEAHVSIMGMRNDMEPVYAQADFLLLPSRRDPFPRVIMEAMCRGIPVVASRVDGIPEMVEDGVTGLLVEPEDVEGFVVAVARLLRDPDLRARMGAAGHKRAQTLFAPESYVKAMLELYASLSPPRGGVGGAGS